MKTISSSSNDIFKSLMTLHTSKGIKKNGEFILSGEKLVREFLKNPFLKIKNEVVGAKHIPLAGLGPHQTLLLTPELFQELDQIGTHFNMLICELPDIPVANMDASVFGMEVVTPLGDPNNLGALIRSCVAFKAEKIVLTKEACHPFLPKTIKASAGAVLSAPLYFGPELLQVPRNQTYALDMHGQSIPNFHWPKDCRLIVGEEGPGLPKNHGFETLAIPMDHGTESLNAVVATSIALYDYRLKRKN